MLDRTVGEYCKDEGTEHEWEMYSREGCIHVECRCGAKAAQFLAEWALELSRVPVNIEFPPECWDQDRHWLDITPRL